MAAPPLHLLSAEAQNAGVGEAVMETKVRGVQKGGGV